MSDTIWVAIITACSSILPNIVITIINNKHSLKVKKYESYISSKQNVIFEFLTSVGKILDNTYQDDLLNFQVSLNKLLLYYPELDRNLIDNIYKSLSDTNLTNKINAILPLIKQLSKSIRDK